MQKKIEDLIKTLEQSLKTGDLTIEDENFNVDDWCGSKHAAYEMGKDIGKAETLNNIIIKLNKLIK